VILGGMLTTWLSWHWVFLVNVPVGLVAAALAVRIVPVSDAPPRGGGLDLPGGSSAILGLAALVYAFSGTATHGWGSAHTLVLLAIAGLLLVAFTAIERSVRRPLVPPATWRNGALVSGAGLTLGATGIMAGTLFLNSVYLQTVLGWSALRSGLAFLPFVVAIGLGVHLTSRVVARAGTRSPAVAGLLPARRGDGPDLPGAVDHRAEPCRPRRGRAGVGAGVDRARGRGDAGRRGPVGGGGRGRRRPRGGLRPRVPGRGGGHRGVGGDRRCGAAGRPSGPGRARRHALTASDYGAGRMTSTPTTDHRRAIAERNVEAILNAAEELLAAGATASTSAVAAAAGVSRVTVYAHFPTREALLEAITERAVRHVGATIEALQLGDGPPAAALQRLISTAWTELDRHRVIAQNAAEHLSGAAMGRAHGSLRGPIEALVARGQDAGAFRDDLTPRWLVSSFFALVHACADDVRAGQLDPAAAVTTLNATITSIVAPPRARRRSAKQR
jgi:AcrR family transcriptional regulator